MENSALQGAQPVRACVCVCLSRCLHDSKKQQNRESNSTHVWLSHGFVTFFGIT